MLAGLVDIVCIVYLNNILIYNSNLAIYANNICKVFK